MNIQLKKIAAMATLTLALTGAVGTKQAFAKPPCTKDKCNFDGNDISTCQPTADEKAAGYTSPAIVDNGTENTDSYMGCFDCAGDCKMRGVYQRTHLFLCCAANANGDLYTTKSMIIPPGNDPVVIKQTPYPNGIVHVNYTVIETLADCQEHVPIVDPGPNRRPI